MIYYFVNENGTSIHSEEQKKGWFKKWQGYDTQEDKAKKKALRRMRAEVKRINALIDDVEKNGIESINNFVFEGM